MTQKPTAGVLVFEKQPFWGPELKRQLTDRWVLVRECRSVQDLFPAGAELAEVVVVLALDAAPIDCLTWMGRQFQNDAHFPLIVVASTELSDLEWPIREAGAVGFVDDEISGDELARLCVRLLRTSGSRVPRVAAPY